MRNEISEQYNIEVIDRSFDGILGLRFEHRSTCVDFIVFSCYLPPENSTRGRDAHSLFAHLLTQVYAHCECDDMFIGADFNARIGSMSDNILDCDTIPSREILDNTKNQHGQDLIDFLNDAKCCVLNGRLGHDNFTSISRKGKAIVDYLCVPHETLKKCSRFKVITVQELTAEHDLQGLLGERSRLPDHSALVTEFHCTDYYHTVNDSVRINTSQKVRFKLKCIPVNFMENERAAVAITAIITQIESARETQNDIDAINKNLCDVILNEMVQSIPTYNSTKRTNRRRKIAKPYWNDDLQDLWNNMSTKERSFLKYKGTNRERTRLRAEYIESRNNFDKLLRQSERAYRETQAMEIDEMSCTNPTEFWRKTQKLGPRKDTSIPIEIADNANIIRDEHVVFERWKVNFRNLYNGGGVIMVNLMKYITTVQNYTNSY